MTPEIIIRIYIIGGLLTYAFNCFIIKTAIRADHEAFKGDDFVIRVATHLAMAVVSLGWVFYILYFFVWRVKHRGD